MANSTIITKAKRDSGGHRWYLVRAEVGRVQKAVTEIRKAGFGAQLIIEKRTVMHKRTKAPIVKTRPAFDRYVFVQMPKVGANWMKLRDCAGVEAVMTATNADGEHYPFAVPRKVVVGLYLKQRRGEFDGTGATAKTRVERLKGLFEKGASVRITDGAFWDFLGEVSKVDQKGRVEVEVMLFGRSTMLTFSDASVLDLIDKPRAA